MLKKDEDALICDFAETYHVYDYKRLPLNTVASLAVGLRDDSRIKMRLSGTTVSPEFMLQAAMVDALNLLVWTKTKYAEKGTNLPKSITDELLKREKDISAFASGKDFDEARTRIINNIERREVTHGN